MLAQEYLFIPKRGPLKYNILRQLHIHRVLLHSYCKVLELQKGSSYILFTDIFRIA